MIYTGYFAKLKLYEKNNLFPISISRITPNWFKGLSYKNLAPTPDILFQYKKDLDEKVYTNLFNKQLFILDKNIVIKDLYELSSNKDIVLLCYESPRNFCHRQLVAKWLDIKEFTNIEK